MKYAFFLTGRRFVAFFCLLLFGLVEVKAADPVSDSLDHALLWRITSPDMSDTSYLFGTIHLISENDFFLPQGFEEAFAKCDKLILEIDLEETISPFNLMGLMREMTMEGDTTLEDLLSKEDYALLSARMEEQGIPIFMLRTLKPIFVVFFLQQDELGGAGFNPEKEEVESTSYEMELLHKAKETGKETGGLETASFQMSLFDKIPYSEQVELLSEALHEEGGGAQPAQELVSFDAMMEAYKAQNIDLLADMILLQDEFTRKYRNLFVVDRNKNWISTMEKLMAEQPVFFAVGAGHLGGEQGVVRLLRAAGYRVEPVKP